MNDGIAEKICDPVSIYAELPSPGTKSGVDLLSGSSTGSPRSTTTGMAVFSRPSLDDADQESHSPSALSLSLSLSDIAPCLTVSDLLLENPRARTDCGLKRELNGLWLRLSSSCGSPW